MDSSPPQQRQQQRQQQQPLTESSQGLSMEGNSNESLRSLELAMKAADVIRKALKQVDDPSEQNLWVPPGTVPGLTAFLVTGLLFSPLRSAILSRAAGTPSSSLATAATAAANARKQTAEAVAKPSETNPPNPPTTTSAGLGSFQNLIDLIVTPAMAVIAAQVGLVVGTLYGSSHYLQRVIEYDGSRSRSSMGSSEDIHLSNGGVLNDVGNSHGHELCSNLLSLARTYNFKLSGDSGVLHRDSSHEMSSSSESFQTGGPSSVIPQLYPAWDPRQTTIESLYQAIRHCRNQQHG